MEDFFSLTLLRDAFSYRAGYLVTDLISALDEQGKAWSDVLLEVSRVSAAHCQYVKFLFFLPSLCPFWCFSFFVFTSSLLIFIRFSPFFFSFWLNYFIIIFSIQVH